MSTKQSRSKTGCLTCKTRRKKCDEQRPTCERCARAKMECLGYSYLDNPEELAQARAKIAAHRSAARAAEQASAPLGPTAGPSEFTAWRGHPAPVRSGSAPSSMTHGPVPGHDIMREPSQSSADTARLEALDFPFLPPQSAASNQSHGQAWWGVGPGAPASGFDQALNAETAAGTVHQVEFHRPRHPEELLANPGYSIPPNTGRSVGGMSNEDAYDSDSSDGSNDERIMNIVCGPDRQIASREGNDALAFVLESYARWMSQTVFEPMRSAQLLRGYIMEKFAASEESRNTLISIATVVRNVGKSSGLTPDQVSHVRMLHRRVQDLILLFNASEPHIYEQGTPQAMKTLNAALEVMPVYLATSSLGLSVSLLREVALAFKRAVLEPPGHPINLPSKLIVPNADLRQYSAMDVMTSLATGKFDKTLLESYSCMQLNGTIAIGCPMSFVYDVTYTDPVLNATGMFHTADALGLQWLYGAPESLMLLLARLHNIRDDVSRRADAHVHEINDIEQSIRSWQPMYPLSQDPHLAVTKLAVQECWRQTLLIYLEFVVPLPKILGFASPTNYS